MFAPQPVVRRCPLLITGVTDVSSYVCNLYTCVCVCVFTLNTICRIVNKNWVRLYFSRSSVRQTLFKGLRRFIRIIFTLRAQTSDIIIVIVTNITLQLLWPCCTKLTVSEIMWSIDLEREMLISMYTRYHGWRMIISSLITVNRAQFKVTIRDRVRR